MDEIPDVRTRDRPDEHRLSTPQRNRERPEQCDEQQGEPKRPELGERFDV